MSDFAAFEQFLSSSRAVGLGGPFDQRGAWAMFCHDTALWMLFGHGALMLELKETGACIGQVGINHGPLFPEKELGWLLYDGYEGKGYATEAAGAMLRWAFTSLGLKTLVSYVSPGNSASIAVAKRLGAILDADAPRETAADLVFRHAAP